ncbi:MAG: hypothetical protein H6Q37_1491 [Chloroflexi bacterium]|nr:hypothetical protein [Chloroflexota bacterium]
MSRARRLREALLFVLLGLLFALAYTQSPLYTSNQNQYFLHGLANADFGYLKQDWLANTLDPTPLFSLLVEWTYRLTHLPALFYLYYAILLGLYLYCMVGIADILFDLRQTPARYWMYIALLFLIHSAALRFGFAKTLGNSWAYILEDGVADQRLLGPVFQPSSFGVLLVVSIYLFLRKQPLLAVLSGALAATIHPTYLLAAGTLTLAYMLVIFLETHKPYKSLLLGGVALLAVTPILFYVYSGFAGTPPETTAKAQDILVNYRIPFHAVISRWLDWRVAVKLVIILAALFLLRKTRLFLVLLVPFTIAIVLTIIQALLKNNTLALLFPWRISTFLVPLSMTVLLAVGVTALFRRFPDWETSAAKWVVAASAVLIGLLVLVGVVRTILDFERQAEAPDRPVMTYVAAHHLPGQFYMIPLEMQDFRLATGSPIYVEFKSIPYQDRDVLEWIRRIQTTDLFYKKADCDSVEKLAAIGITHVIADYRLFNWGNCPDWEQVYQDPNYRIYRIR